MRMARRNDRKGRSSRLQLLIFPVLALVMVAALFLMMRFITGETQTKTGEPIYQYFLDQKVEYDEETTIVPGTNGVVFSQGDEKNDGDPTPIYYKGSTALLLPTDMSWMDPVTNREWKLPAFSRLEMDESGGIWYCNGDDRIRMEGGFLNSGRGTYVFLDTASLQFSGLAYDVEPFSFYSVSNGMYRIYQYQREELIVEETETKNVTIWAAKGYQADLSVGIYTAADGSQRLLAASPTVLKEIGER